jgi:hypothetical protein
MGEGIAQGHLFFLYYLLLSKKKLLTTVAPTTTREAKANENQVPATTEHRNRL